MRSYYQATTGEKHILSSRQGESIFLTLPCTALHKTCVKWMNAYQRGWQVTATQPLSLLPRNAKHSHSVQGNNSSILTAPTKQWVRKALLVLLLVQVLVWCYFFSFSNCIYLLVDWKACIVLGRAHGGQRTIGCSRFSSSATWGLRDQTSGIRRGQAPLPTDSFHRLCFSFPKSRNSSLMSRWFSA